MFSQYSWGDFIKFVLALAIPYYAFVLWKYYREDIREWISNRGQTPAPAAEAIDNEDEDEDDGELYTVTSRVTTTSSPNPQPNVTTPAAATNAPKQPAPAPSLQKATKEPELSEGVVLAEEQTNGFDLPLPLTLTRAGEESLDDVLETAKSLSADEKGKVVAQDLENKKAVGLAAAINQQQGSSVFGGMAFTR